MNTSEGDRRTESSLYAELCLLLTLTSDHGSSRFNSFLLSFLQQWSPGKRSICSRLTPSHLALVRSILEYGSPVWAALPDYLSDVVEGVQRKALRIVFPGLAYSEALVASGLQTLATRRGQA